MQKRTERQYFHRYADHEAGDRYDPSPGFGAGMSEDDLSNVFAQAFGRRSGGAGPGGFKQEFHARGQDLRYHLEVDFLNAALGTKRRITMPDGNSIEITIPPGLKDGQRLRLRGNGIKGPAGKAGDQIVRLSIALPNTIDGEMEELARSALAHGGSGGPARGCSRLGQGPPARAGRHDREGRT